ncbi:MAG: T9SS type A sorting domain-containing protein [Bacteroidia bacterium]
MKKYLLITLALSATVFSSAQKVTTYAGKAHSDLETNFERASGVDLNNTYFSKPEGICFDDNGKMYISEVNKIRSVISNKLYIRAGSLQKPSLSEGYQNNAGIQATFRNPAGMVADANGNIYVADEDNHCIRKIAAYINIGNPQAVTTFAGAAPTVGLPGYGTEGTANGTGTAARFSQPKDITRDANGNFYVTEYGNYTIRKISPSGVVTTLAGKAGVEGTADGTGTAATFGGPWGVAMLDANHIVVVDNWNTNIRKVNINTGVTTTLAGPSTGPTPGQVDGTLTAARFKSPKGVAVVGGIIYVTDQNLVRAIDVSKNSVTTFAGNKALVEVKDGTGSAAAFTELSNIETDGLGNLFVTENSIWVNSSVIRKIEINDLAPVADFTASETTLVTDQLVTLTDQSTGQTPTSRTWTITPMDYTIKSGSLSNNVVGLSFSKAGFYDVKLSITNDFGTNVKTKESYLVVSTIGNVKERYESSDAINVYPNPANNTFSMKFEIGMLTESTVVELYQINGQKVSTIDPYVAFNTSELPNGSYFITITTDNVKYAKKLVIAHK